MRPPSRFFAKPLPMAAGLLAVAAALALTGTFWLSRETGRRAVADQEERLRERGVPLNLEELARFYHDPALPPEQNAAAVLTEVFALLNVGRNEVRRLTPSRKRPGPGQPLFSENVAQETAELLERNAEALRLVRQTAGFSHGRFPVDFQQGFDFTLPHLNPLRDIAGLLALEAAWEIQRGGTAEAAANVKLLFHIAQLLDAEPGLISNLPLTHVLDQACRSLEILLNRSLLPNGMAGEFDRLLSEADRLTIHAAMKGETAINNERFARWLQAPPDFSADERFIEFLFRAYVFSGRMHRDQLFFLETMEDLLSHPLVSDQIKAVGKIDAMPFNPLAKGLVSQWFLLVGVERMLQSKAESHARLRMVRLLLACERHRLRHGDFPTAPEALIPAFLPELPPDPLGEGTFEFQREEEGIRILSQAETGPETDRQRLSTWLAGPAHRPW